MSLADKSRATPLDLGRAFGLDSLVMQPFVAASPRAAAEQAAGRP